MNGERGNGMEVRVVSSYADYLEERNMRVYGSLGELCSVEVVFYPPPSFR